MSVIHATTLIPSKLDLLTTWLPQQQWYRGESGQARLARAGGFRLDDPDGEVGIEFMIALDGSGPETVAYHVPMTYRVGPMPEAPDAVIGTAEHGVLGTRYIHDGTRDPVLLAAVAELLRGRAQPQAQSVSDTQDPTVVVRTVSGPLGRRLDVQFARALVPEPADVSAASLAPPGVGLVTAPWTGAHGARVRSVLITSQPA